MAEHAGVTRARSRVARRLLEALVDSSPDLRAAAVLDAEGAQLVSSDGRDWSARAGKLWRAAERERSGADQIHIAADSGEVFAVRDGSVSIVATTDRLPLESLVLSDLRAVLREIGSEVG